MLISKACSIVLVPIITISAGGLIGKAKSDKITEYKTITRTVDLNTGNVIGDISYEYDDKVTTYAATVLVCDPWRKIQLVKDMLEILKHMIMLVLLILLYCYCRRFSRRYS